MALKVRDQHLDPALAQARAGLANRLGKDRRAAVRQVVAVDRCDDDVVEAEGVDGMGDALGFRGIDRPRPAVRDGAVRAGARADVAEDHERRRPVVPALADVGTARFLAHRVQVEIAHQPLEAQVARRPRRTDLQPCRLRFARVDNGERNDRGHRRIDGSTCELVNW